MNAKQSDWLGLALSMLGCAVVTVALSLVLNLTGDCGPGVERCGETARRLSFIVLALGMAGLVYLVVRFIRRHLT